MRAVFALLRTRVGPATKTRSHERQSALRAVSSERNHNTTRADCKSAAGCNPALHLASTKSTTCALFSRECERCTHECVRHKAECGRHGVMRPSALLPRLTKRTRPPSRVQCG